MHLPGAAAKAAAILATVFVASACALEAPPRGLEHSCVESCEARAASCSPRQCRRGCNQVIDRLVQHQGERVLACVASAPAAPPVPSACDDRAWARCATLVGPYADGGPPPPPPPPEDVLQGEGD